MSDSVSESAENDMATELFEMCISFGDDNLEAVQSLLQQSKAQDQHLVNAANGDGDTPLHVAARCGYLHLCKLLTAEGADPLIRNGRNRTPGGQTHLDPDIKEYLKDQEESAKHQKRQKQADAWNDKMRATQTQNACGVGVL